MIINKPKQLEIAIEYYNRGEIHVCFLESDICSLENDEKQPYYEKKIEQYPTKIIITTCTTSERLYHSHPCILTQDKLISIDLAQEVLQKTRKSKRCDIE